MTGPYGWAAQQLTECLVRLGECEDVPAAVRTGLDLAAETFEAEAGVVVREGSVVASRGFPASESPPADWGVSADGSRFLVMTPERSGASTSLSLIFDWQGMLNPRR